MKSETGDMSSGGERPLAVAGETASVAASRAAQRRISVLGATGSIGQNTLDLIGRAAPGEFEIVALTANADAGKLAELAVRHRARIAVVAEPDAYTALRDALAGTGIEAVTDPRRIVVPSAACVVAQQAHGTIQYRDDDVVVPVVVEIAERRRAMHHVNCRIQRNNV